jgi:hypothetical protein
MSVGHSKYQVLPIKSGHSLLFPKARLAKDTGFFSPSTR